MIANVNRGKKEDKLFQPSDFMPPEMVGEKSETKIQSVQEQEMILKQIFGWAKKKGLTKKDKLMPPMVKAKPIPGKRKNG